LRKLICTLRKAVLNLSPTNDRELTTHEVAKLLGRTTRSIRRYIVAGKIPAPHRAPFSNVLLWYRDEIDLYLVEVKRG
jgi:hypothetical protein